MSSYFFVFKLLVLEKRKLLEEIEVLNMIMVILTLFTQISLHFITVLFCSF